MKLKKNYYTSSSNSSSSNNNNNNSVEIKKYYKNKTITNAYRRDYNVTNTC